MYHTNSTPVNPVVSKRLKVAIDRHSLYIIIFTHSVCFTEQQLVGFRSREGQAVAQPIPPPQAFAAKEHYLEEKKAQACR
jgi:hypothetical protein